MYNQLHRLTVSFPFPLRKISTVCDISTSLDDNFIEPSNLKTLYTFINVNSPQFAGKRTGKTAKYI